MKIFLAGHKGLVGSAIVRRLKEDGYTRIITKDRSECDLTKSDDVRKLFEENRIDFVFDAAARVGGIYANDVYSAEFIYQNTMIQTNLIHWAYKYFVKKFVFLGSVCIYPKFAETPVKEESILTGELEPTNEAYAIAKIHGIEMLKMYNKQYGFKGVSLRPSNLYGPGDNFHPENGHVIPALMTKFNNATDTVTCWGDGTPIRDLIYAKDVAEGMLHMVENSVTEPVNLGSGTGITIKQSFDKGSGGLCKKVYENGW